MEYDWPSSVQYRIRRREAISLGLHRQLLHVGVFDSETVATNGRPQIFARNCSARDPNFLLPLFFLTMTMVNLLVIPVVPVSNSDELIHRLERINLDEHILRARPMIPTITPTWCTNYRYFTTKLTEGCSRGGRL
jgi:hypothetical protein